jgi:adenine-specific DNA-methyltransferase
MCKLEGFRYAPSQTVFWQHGQSTERDFIYVTTQTLTHEQLGAISEDVGPQRTLLICCSAFRAKADAFPNLTVKKIPAAVLARCEWGRDDYSLNVRNVMGEEVETEPAEPAAGRNGSRRGRRKKAVAVQELLPLFPKGGDK